MPLQTPQMVELFRVVDNAYPDIGDLGVVLMTDMFLDLDDLAPDTLSRRQRIMAVVKAVNARDAAAFIAAVINDPATAANNEVQQRLPPMLALLNPQPGVPPHEHLTTDGVAFANRTTLRMDVARMLRPDGPKVLVLRGAPLSGASYVFRLINHVGRESGLERVTINFAHNIDNSPLGVVTTLAREMGIAQSPVRVDDPGNAHLSTSLVPWLAGHIRNSPKTWWVVFDNAQLNSVPPETKEMIVAFAQHFAQGVLDNVRLFILGFDLEIAGVGPPGAQDFNLHCIGRPEIVDFLTLAQAQFGPLPGFGSVDEAADNVINGIDLVTVNREGLTAITAQLTHLISEMRQ